eukprot:Em0021g956a
MLYGIVGILKEHVTACGTDEELPAEELARDKGPSRGSSANKDRSTICKYYLQGKCKFGDKCLQQHASKHKPQITVVDEGSDKKGTARKEPKSNDSLHPTADENPRSKRRVPMIQYFKYKNTIVWDKRCQLDDFFGSRGGKLISDFVDKTAVNAKQVEQVEPQESKAVASSQKEEGQAFLDEEEEPEEDDVSSAGAVDNKDRPNHFVCLHITSMEVKAGRGVSPHRCAPRNLVHASAELRARQSHGPGCLSDARTQFIHILPPCLQLTFRGVDNFRGRLVYVRVEPEPALERFVSYLLEQFQQAGLGTPGNHDQFTPHMTILKLTRPMARKLHTHAISPASYLAYRESPVGQHTVDNLQLCSMTAGKQGDGFYLRLETISNSLCGLPLFSTVLINHLNMLALQGIVTGAERDKLTHKVLQGGVHFEVAVEDIRQLCCQESARGLCTVPGQPIVVIMRGVPGSGKSHLVNSCKEMLTDPSSVAVCSADQYFSEAPGGYKFATHLLPKAHAHCLGRFVHALTEGKRLLVVDNTNSKLWEYRVYVFICEVLGLKCHVLEIPCEHPSITNMFCSRNVHGVDSAIVNRLVQRWEKDSNATYVPPSLILPRPSPAQPELFSLLSLCDPDSSVGTLDPVVPIYTGIFLPCHAALRTQRQRPPGVWSGEASDGEVTGKVDNGKVQAVTVELPRGVSCGNRFPHITISTNEGVLPKEANTVLEAQPAQPFSACVPLGGVVGVMVSGEGGGEGSVDPMGRFENKTTPPSFLVTSEADLHQFVLPRLKQKEVSQEDMEAILAARVSACEICTGTLPITQLFVFDFDGTLFNTPNPLEGRVMYEQLTAVAEFRRHLNIAGSFTILMTGRAQRIARAVKLILDNAHLVPQRYVFKPNISLKSTSAYKSRVIQELLEEFPQVTVVKIWDDDEDNLSAFHQVAKSCSRDIQFDIIDATRTPALQEGRSSSKATRVPTPSALKKYLMSYGYIPSPVHSVAATSGVRFLAERHASAIGFHGDPLLLAYEFGSHLLGRDGDVDMCLLVPPSFTVDAAMERMEASLRSCGVTHVHAGHSSRCPRLKTMLCFPTTSSINYDIVFAVVAMDTFFSAPPPTQLPVSEVLGYIKAGDSASKAALNGPVFLQHVDTIISGVLTRQQFGLVVEAVVQLLSANGQKGNSYHCIRTFHVVQLLADFVKAQKAMPTADFTPDHLFKEFVTHVALLAPDKWAKLFGEFVPQEFIPRVTKIFSKASQHVSVEDYPSITVFEDMMSHAQFPPEGYTTVDLILSGTDDSQLWKLHTLIESRLPTYIRQLLRCGLDVTPDGHVRNERKFSFAVPNSKQTKDTLQQVLRPLWNELADYRKNKSASVELTFGMAVQGAEGKGDLEEQVAQFARTTTSTELHLPPSLSSYERLKVHEAAEQLGLVHCTVGNGKSKHIVIKKR